MSREELPQGVRSALKKLPGPITTRELNRWLHKESKYAEFQQEVADLQQAENLDSITARNRVAEKYGFKYGVLPRGAKQGFEDSDGSYVETLDWVCKALGWADEGKPVSRLDAPGPRAWGMFNWASTDAKSRKEFFTLWTTASRRATAEDSAEAADVKRQDAELRAMLEEVQAEIGT